jgi:hypothetical protein
MAAACVLGASDGGAVLNGGAQAATPPLSWQDVSRLHLLCLVASDRLGERERIEKDLCEQVRTIAAAGAPIPVEPAAFGDPVILDPAGATLLVHAAIQQVADDRLIVFSVRIYRAGGAANDILFGAPPRAAPLGDRSALAASLRSALSETLPWHPAR